MPKPARSPPGPTRVFIAEGARGLAAGDTAVSDGVQSRWSRCDAHTRAHGALATLGLWLTVASISSGATASERPVPAPTQVLFVCEHGNVKSLMAASYFNAAATELGISVHAVSRGVAPDSTSVPVAIADGLRTDGIDVSTFVPTRVAKSDVRSSARVVLIETDLPAGVPLDGTPTEHWNDVPPASVDFAGARQALRVHVRELIRELARGTP